MKGNRFTEEQIIGVLCEQKVNNADAALNRFVFGGACV